MPPATAALEHDYWSRTTRLKHRELHGLPRYKLEIGDQIPVGIVAQLDIKMDDGSADAGIHQFAPFSPGDIAFTGGCDTACLHLHGRSRRDLERRQGRCQRLWCLLPEANLSHTYRHATESTANPGL